MEDDNKKLLKKYDTIKQELQGTQEKLSREVAKSKNLEKNLMSLEEELKK